MLPNADTHMHTHT